VLLQVYDGNFKTLTNSHLVILVFTHNLYRYPSSCFINKLLCCACSVQNCFQQSDKGFILIILYTLLGWHIKAIIHDRFHRFNCSGDMRVYQWYIINPSQLDHLSRNSYNFSFRLLQKINQQ
jgi:hypothetical protein